MEYVDVEYDNGADLNVDSGMVQQYYGNGAPGSQGVSYMID